MVGNVGRGGAGETWFVVMEPLTRVEHPEHDVPEVALCTTWEDPLREIDDVEDVRSWPTTILDAVMLAFAHTSWATVQLPLVFTLPAYTLPWTLAELLQLHTPPV